MARKSSDRSINVSHSFDRPLHGGNLVWAASLANCSPSAILDFSASINPNGPPASAIAAIQSALPTLTTYPDPQYHQLRRALAQFHQISPDWIMPGNGAAELLTWAGRELAALSGVCLLTPAFSDYYRAVQAFSGKVLACPLPDLGQPALMLDSSILPASAGKPLGFLLNNPHNPTGLLFNRDEILPYLDQFALVVVDEAFMDFLPPDQQQSLIAWVPHHPNLVVLRSLTKFYSLPGLRLGYAIAHPDRLQRWQQWRDPWSVNTLAAIAGAVVVQDDQFQQETWNWLAGARSMLYDGLARLPGLTPSLGVANFLLVRSDYPVLMLQIELLQRHQILIRDCLSFPELGDRHFRVAVRSQAENQRLLDGLTDVIGHRSDLIG